MGALAGKKTYITAALVAIVTGLRLGGIITDDQAKVVYEFLAAFGLYAVRSAIGNGNGK